MRQVAFVTVLALAAGANAQIIGGSSIIGNAELNTLSGWLGEGPLQITNIFDHTAFDGKDSYAFHAAADAQGRTFVIIKDVNGNVFGGYNPQSWNSFQDYNYSPDPNDRKAFLFNLTNNIKIDQRTSSEGYYQTYNANYYGPTFGGGHDLYTDTALGDYGSGYSYGYSYGNINDGQQYNYTTFQTAEMEVFTIAVPAPGAGALLGIGGLIAARRRRA